MIAVNGEKLLKN